MLISRSTVSKINYSSFTLKGLQLQITVVEISSFGKQCFTVMLHLHCCQNYSFDKKVILLNKMYDRTILSLIIWLKLKTTIKTNLECLYEDKNGDDCCLNQISIHISDKEKNVLLLRIYKIWILVTYFVRYSPFNHIISYLF